MTAQAILEQLRLLGQDSYKKIMLKHGVVEPVYGVKIEELKKIQKAIKRDYQLALDLYETGVYDAMYLAGLVADDQAMTLRDLRHWAENATSAPLSEYTVPWVAAQGAHGWELALEWIDAPPPGIAVSGWSTLAGLMALTADDQLSLVELRGLLQRVKTTLSQQPVAVQSAMKNFMIAAGSHVRPLTETVLEMGERTPQLAAVAEAVHKTEKRGAIGKKRKTIKC